MDVSIREVYKVKRFIKEIQNTKTIINSPMIWNKIFKRNKTKYPEYNHLKLLVIDNKAPTVTEGLGITEERAEQLRHYVQLAFMYSQDSFYILEKVIDKCKHTNEVTFVVMEFSRTRISMAMANGEFKTNKNSY